MRLLEFFSGTKSIGRSFQKRGWEVVSLDLTNEFNPTIQADILTWDYKSCYPPGYFMAIWASPCCTNYSRARTRGGPRDLVGADELVQKTIDIIDYFNATYYYIENPWTGLLRRRDVVYYLPPPYRFDYCQFGAPYRKATAVWSNNQHLENKICTGNCHSFDGRKHGAAAQRGQGKGRGNLSVNTLHAIPEQLCDDIAWASEQH